MTEMTTRQKDAYDKIIGLRYQSAQSGLITKRTQNSILGALTDQDLAVCAGD